MNRGSVTDWIERIKQGSDGVAERELWDRYYARLAALARKKLEDLPPNVRDDEELALSALNTFFLRAKRGCFPKLQDRADLWQLLAKITVRKSIDQRRHARAHKRNSDRCPERSVGQVYGISKFEERLIEIAASKPTPDMLASINEECQRLMGALDHDLLPVARMKLEGYTNKEIANVLGRVERTVERKLERIRKTWLMDVGVS